MIVTARDSNILKTLQRPQIAAYLEKKQWHEQSRDGDKLSILNKKNEACE